MSIPIIPSKGNLLGDTINENIFLLYGLKTEALATFEAYIKPPTV